MRYASKAPRWPLGRPLRRAEPHVRERRHHPHPWAGRWPSCAARVADQSARPGPATDLCHSRHQFTKGTRTVNPQTLARLTGVLFLITYATSIPAFFVFYAPVLNDPGYITGAGPDTSVLVGAFLEVLLILANIGSALTLFPVLKRHNEVLALGYVTARLVESGFIAVGILSLGTVVTLRQEAAGADAAALTLIGQTLVAIHNWTFLLGPN